MKERALLVIAPEPPPYTGMEVATQALLAELRSRGISYQRVNTADPQDPLRNRGSWTRRNVLMALHHIHIALRKSFNSKIGAVYVPIAQAFPALFRDTAFLLIAQMARLPAIVHLHGGVFGDYYASLGPFGRSLLERTVGGATVGIVLTERLRPALEGILPRERIFVVANGIELPLTRHENRASHNEVHVLFLSSLYRWKGPFHFIDAFARAHAKRPQLRATVAGDWPSEEVRRECLRLVRERGIEHLVGFPGMVAGEAKAQLFHDADIFCFASLKPEGQPLVILEAMAAGLPVVAPAWPGIADTVVDGETGLLLAESSSDAFADRLIRLADRPEERHRLGSAGRTRYEAYYTQRAFGERMVRILAPFLQSEYAPKHKSV